MLLSNTKFNDWSVPLILAGVGTSLVMEIMFLAKVS